MEQLPPFQSVFIKLLRSGLQALDLEAMTRMASRLSADSRTALASYLGEDGLAQVLEGMPEDKRSFLLDAARDASGAGEQDFARLLPQVMREMNAALPLAAFKLVIAGLAPADLASQSEFLGTEGRKTLFSAMGADKVQVLLDHTDDGVLVQAGMQTARELNTLTATLLKRERVGSKLQDEETISIKLREQPRGVYMKWLAGPFKGREMLYDEKGLGARRIRVREGGLLGVLPVTIAEDAAIAKRGTNHTATEVGPRHLLRLIERDYQKAAPRGHIKRVNHGIRKLDGIDVYVMESVLPRDRSLGYYCYRMMHFTDYVRSLELRSEVYNFDDELQESFYYKDVVVNPPLTDRDFDTSNPSYRLG
jgi:hypothetical protein